jgi:uncharacterized protein YraI
MRASPLAGRKGPILFRLGIALIGLSLLLSACAGAATPTAAPTQPPAAVPTQAPPAAPPPAPGPTAMPLSAQPVVPPAVEGSPWVVANNNTWIYSGPGKEYVVYAALLGGQTAQVTGKSEDGLWWAISVPVAPGGNGWVEGAWVTAYTESVPVLPTPPLPPSTALVPPAAGDPQATALVNTNVRSGPGETYPAYGVALAGATGRVLGKSEDGAWWAVRIDPALVGAGYGWVAGSTVEASNVEGVATIAAPLQPPVVTPPQAPPEGAPSATALDYVNLRTGPGSCNPAYAIAPPGATGEVIGVSEDGQWWQVKLPVEVAAVGYGWVSAAYVSTSNTASVPVVAGGACEDAGVPSPGAYECVLTGQSPLDYTVLDSGSAFEMQWTLVNTGADPWNKNVAHFVQAGQTGELHTGDDSFAVEDDITNGESVSVNVSAEAPDAAGTYGELWELNANGPVVCQFWMIINVK